MHPLQHDTRFVLVNSPNLSHSRVRMRRSESTGLGLWWHWNRVSIEAPDEQKHDAVLSREEMVRAEALGALSRIRSDTRDLNYATYLEKDEQKTAPPRSP